MHEDTPEDLGNFDFDDIADYLLEQGAQCSPAQLHGCMSGLLCAGASTGPEYGLNALEHCLDVRPHGEFAERVMQLYTFTAQALRDEGFTFQPLLPVDEEELDLRTLALANWCEGFLTGFAWQAAAESAPALSPDAGEVLTDIAAMAQAVTTEEDNEDEAEDSYCELVEYLRVAVVNVFQECGASR